MDFKGISFYPENELHQCKISINIYNDVKFISNLNYRRFGEKYIYNYYLLNNINEILFRKHNEIEYPFLPHSKINEKMFRYFSKTSKKSYKQTDN